MDNNTVLYQIYPLGFCGAPKENDGVIVSRIRKVMDWIPHMKKLGITSLYMGPIFDSDRHGYDTRNYEKIDVRLGTNQDFIDVCNALHAQGISIVLDGVFNHVGRGFFGFQDVLEKKWDSPYKDWFYVDFNNQENEDGFTYQNWEGHPELVKLNLQNPDVQNYLLNCIDGWRKDYGIDGLRLDVAYCIDQDFLRLLHAHCKEADPSFFLLGEMIHGDYRQIVNDSMCDSATNYECQKGIFSSFNTHNLFEIAYSLNRQFGKEDWCLYRRLPLVSFLDNHDVNRIASTLVDSRDLPLAYALLTAMPGIPCIYYGSEWGAQGTKDDHSDDALRPSFDQPQWNDVTTTVASLNKMRVANSVFLYGDYQQLILNNQQFAFSRAYENKQVFFAMNIDESPSHFDLDLSGATNLLTNQVCESQEGIELEGKSACFFVKTFD